MLRLLVLLGFALTIALVAAACGDDDSGDDASATPSATASPTPSPATTPSPSPTPALHELTIGDAMDLPQNMAMIVETGCWSCDGPAESFVRAYWDEDAHRYISEVVFDPADYGGHMIVNHVFAEDASEMYVTVCVQGYCGGLDGPSPDAKSKVLRSRDGGVTWAEVGELASGWWPVAIVEQGLLVMSRTSGFSGEEQVRYAYAVFPGGARIEPPNGDATLRPYSLSGGELLWFAEDGRFLREDGTVAARLPDPDTKPYPAGISGDLKGSVVIAWVEQAGPPYTAHLAFFEPGAGGGLAMTLDYSQTGIYFGGIWRAKEEIYYTNADVPADAVPAPPSPLPYFGQAPVGVDVATGTLRPVASPFFDADFVDPNPRNLVRAIQTGPFLRVAGTGSCLNIRAEPSVSGQVLNCAADGVLLLDVGSASHLITATPAAGWREVITPAGVHGFASGEFLD